MIMDFEDEPEICFDSTGALDLSIFKQDISKETENTEHTCDVCGDKATGKHITLLSCEIPSWSDIKDDITE